MEAHGVQQDYRFILLFFKEYLFPHKWKNNSIRVWNDMKASKSFSILGWPIPLTLTNKPGNSR